MELYCDETGNTDLITGLYEYMLDETVMKKSLPYKMNTTPKPLKLPKTPLTDNKTKEIFIPSEKDSLFWCFYIMKYGEIQYEMFENKNIVTEKKIKIDYVEKMRKEKQIIKTYKFSTLTNLENNLANESNLCLTSFLSLCAVENFNILVIKNKTFFELRMNDTEDFFIIYQLNGTRFGLKNSKCEEVNILKEPLFKIDNIGKPMKAIAAYKLQDLLDISKKLSIETINTTTNKTKNKKDLYENIINYF